MCISIVLLCCQQSFQNSPWPIFGSRPTSWDPLMWDEPYEGVKCVLCVSQSFISKHGLDNVQCDFISVQKLISPGSVSESCKDQSNQSKPTACVIWIPSINKEWRVHLQGILQAYNAFSWTSITLKSRVERNYCLWGKKTWITKKDCVITQKHYFS